MSVHLFEGSIVGNPPEPLLLEGVTVRLMADSERERFDQELAAKHYLKNGRAVGRVLRYVAEYQGQWVALLVFSSPAFHIKLRDQWLHWSPRQVKERRHLIAQNARFLVLATPRQWPNSRATRRAQPGTPSSRCWYPTTPTLGASETTDFVPSQKHSCWITAGPPVAM
jgi:hypothetical protein